MSKKKVFIEDESLIKICNKVIADKKLDNVAPLTIKCVLVAPNISKYISAKCVLPSKELKFFGNFDYLLEFSEDVWSKIDDQTREILMWHELLHIQVTNDKEGESVNTLYPHDVNEFYQIIQAHGINWLGEFKTIVASIHDLDPVEKDKIKI